MTLGDGVAQVAVCDAAPSNWKSADAEPSDSVMLVAPEFGVNGVTFRVPDAGVAVAAEGALIDL
jgi:hypothetical protein